MNKKRLSKSIRKSIRHEKARIRRSFLSDKDKENKIKELYQHLEIKKGKEYSQVNEDKSKKKKRNISKSDDGKNGISKSS